MSDTTQTGMQQSLHRLNFPNLLNVRDLGIYTTRQGRPLRPRSILRADDLCRLTPGGAQALLDYGVRTVIDLRWPVDAVDYPNFLHKQPGLVNHLHLSLLKSSVEHWREVRTPGPKESFNCRVLDHAQPDTAAILRAIVGAPAGPVLFHCVSGKDRTGLIAALLLALVDVDPAEIARDYGLSTENLRDPYLARYPNSRDDVLERVRCPPEQIYNMLAHLEDRYDGVVGYLRVIGLSETEIEQLKQRLM
jgi:protein-tyrosine phosphatase